jgi:hypothetical protein
MRSRIAFAAGALALIPEASSDQPYAEFEKKHEGQKGIDGLVAYWKRRHPGREIEHIPAGFPAFRARAQTKRIAKDVDVGRTIPNGDYNIYATVEDGVMRLHLKVEGKPSSIMKMFKGALGEALAAADSPGRTETSCRVFLSLSSPQVDARSRPPG